MNAWWDASTSNAIFAAMGAGVGVIGGLIGTIVGVGAPRGKGRLAANVLHVLGVLIGLQSLAIAVGALASRQPYHVWYPALLLGCLATPLFSVLWFAVTRRVYRQAEERRLDAQLLRGS
jgi:hypothetical protein